MNKGLLSSQNLLDSLLGAAQVLERRRWISALQDLEVQCRETIIPVSTNTENIVLGKFKWRNYSRLIHPLILKESRVKQSFMSQLYRKTRDF